MNRVARAPGLLWAPIVAALSSPGLALGAPDDGANREIRVQVVAETSATIGAPMAGRLTQFPLHDGERFTQGEVLAKFFCAEKEGALAHARALLEGRRRIFESKQTLHNLGTSSEVEFKVAEAEAAEAAADVTTAQAATESCTVTAPFTGRVAATFTHNFQFLGTGAPLIEILSDKDLELELILPSQWLAWLKPGTPFQVTVDETGKTYAAKLTRLSGKVDAVSRSIKVYGHIDQPDEALLPGMSGQARFSPRRAARVPRGQVMNSPPLNYQLLRLSALLQLEQRARGATRSELKFLIVNDTASVVPYQQAVLWQSDAAGAQSFTLSGVAVADDGGPYRVWLDQVVAAITRGDDAKRIHVVAARELPGGAQAEWEEWFPPQALWCPLVRSDGKLVGGMLFGRADPWGEGDQQLIETLGGGYAQCLVLADQQFKRRIGIASVRRPRVLIGIAAVILLVALIPVRESVLAPAEIAPVDPAPVRSPFEGVVYALHVAPNDPVHAGQKLVSLDKTELQTKLAVAQKALDMAAEEYSGTSQEAMDDPKAKSRLSILQSKVDQQKAELAYDREMLDRAEVTAPADGIAVFDDSNEWAGKPVALGERIMLIASPTDTQLEIQVPASEVVTFEPGSKVAFFSNLNPDRPAGGKLIFASYSSAVTAEGVLSYAFRAKLDPGEPALRLGLKGTAKIYGPRRSFILWALRRPIAAIRKTLSL